jgi:hypothetical protein
VRLALVLLALSSASAAHAACEEELPPWDTGWAQDSDCDGDGFTPAEGDCNDLDAEVRPNADEICGDRIDNDCDGFYDQGCDRGSERGSVQGGAGCGAGAGVGTLGLLGLIPLFGLRRRRR